MSSGAIAWYDRHAATIADTYERLEFKAAHGWLLDILPEGRGLILDVGAGSGRDAAGFAGMGHDVLAVEPSSSMLREGSMRHADTRIRWLDDRLPALEGGDPESPWAPCFGASSGMNYALMNKYFRRW